MFTLYSKNSWFIHVLARNEKKICVLLKLGNMTEEELGDDRVRDHCHFTGKYRGPAHNECNLLLKKDKTIPVGFHNGQIYDFHLFVKSLGRVNGHIRTIAKNSEKYISVEKAICVGEY